MTRNNSVDPRQKYHTDYIYVPVWKEWIEYLFVFQFYFIVTIRNDGFWPKRDNKHNREKKTRKPAFDAFFIFLSNKKEIRHIRKTIPRSIISFVIKCCEHFKIPNKRNSNEKNVYRPNAKIPNEIISNIQIYEAKKKLCTKKIQPREFAYTKGSLTLLIPVNFYSRCLLHCHSNAKTSKVNANERERRRCKHMKLKRENLRRRQTKKKQNNRMNERNSEWAREREQKKNTTNENEE